MKKGFRGLIVAVLAALLLTACNQVIGEERSGETVTMRAGDTFLIKLAGNPTTGYGWQLADVDASILKQDGNPAYKADSLLVGSGGVYTYKFIAQAAGTTTLNLSYLRSWEKNVPPEKTFTLTVVVQ